MGTLEPALKQFGFTELFVGVVVVAIIGNAAEHYSGDRRGAPRSDDAGGRDLGRQQRADRAARRAGGRPLLVRDRPTDVAALQCRSKSLRSRCRFSPRRWSSLDGESNWVEGLQLISVYTIIALAFYFIP